MSIAFSCTSCGKSFRVPDDMAGKKGKCPQCQAVFRIPAESKKKKKAPKADDAFAFDAPGAALEDFSNEVAATGGAPHAPPREGGSGKMVLMVYTFVFMVVAGTVGAAIVFKDQLVVPPTINADLKYMPDQCSVLASFNFTNLRNSDAYKRLKQDLEFDPDPDIEQFVQVLKPDEIHRLTIGFAPSDDGVPSYIVVMRSKKELFPGDVKKAIESAAGRRPWPLDKVMAESLPLALEEKTVGSHTMYGDADWAFALPSTKTLITGKPAIVKAVLERNKRPRFGTPMQAAMNQIDFDRAAFALVVETAPVAQAAGQRFPPALDFIPQEQVEKNQAFGFEIDLNAGLALKSVSVCNDAKTAKDYAKESNDKLPGLYTGFNANADAFKALAPIIENTKTKSKKNILTITTFATTDDLVKIAKEIQQAASQPMRAFNEEGGRIGGPEPPPNPNPDAPKEE